ncbi:MAG: hypothetical protein V1492_03395 [Candidatus Micrarchaeota archaeon]
MIQTQAVSYKLQTLSQKTISNSAGILLLGRTEEHGYRMANFLHRMQRRDPKFDFSRYAPLESTSERKERVRTARSIVEFANPVLYRNAETVTEVWEAIRALERGAGRNTRDAIIISATSNTSLTIAAHLVSLRAIVSYALMEHRLPEEVLTKWEHAREYTALEWLVKPEIMASMSTEEKKDLKVSLILISLYGDSVEALLPARRA